MNWIILLSIKEIKKDIVSLKLLFTDITLSSAFQKIEENIDISKINQIEKKIMNVLNYKVALKDNIYLLLENDTGEVITSLDGNVPFQQKEYFKKNMPNIWNRISDEIELKSFFLIISNIYNDRFKCLLENW